ncbi:hypothetical protein ACOSP7_024258 [Xanthoceras sorbifolium]
MGNCQAIDAATVAVQHPCGKVDKFYWAVSASEIMRMNPGHYVALLISTTLCNSNSSQTNNNNNNNVDNSTTINSGSSSSVRLTRIKLLRPTDTLVLGQVYRLVTTQDVMKGLLAKKHAKMTNKNIPESAEKKKKPEISVNEKPRRSSQLEKDNNHQVMKHERHRPRTAPPSSTTNSSGASKSRIWQPSLQSISESAS